MTQTAAAAQDLVVRHPGDMADRIDWYAKKLADLAALARAAAHLPCKPDEKAIHLGGNPNQGPRAIVLRLIQDEVYQLGYEAATIEYQIPRSEAI